MSSTVLDHLADAPAVRRRDARERVAAVDRLEHGGLLAVQVLVRALEDEQPDAFGAHPAATTSAMASRTRADLGHERCLEAEDDLIGADGRAPR